MPSLLLLAAGALAQDAAVDASYLESHLYQPPIDATRMLWTEDADVRTDALVNLHSTFIYEPLLYTGADGVPLDDASASQVLRTDVQGALTVRGIQIGLDIPLYTLDQTSIFDGQSTIGDLAIDGKVGLIRGEDALGHFAVGGRLLVPTAGAAIGDGDLDAVAWEARLMADTEVMDRISIAGNLGTRGLPDELVATQGFRTQAFFRAGAGWDVIPEAGLSLDLVGAFDYGRPVDDQLAPVQGFVGAYGRVADAFVIRGGLGSGLIPGTEGAAMRGGLTIGWEPVRGFDEDLDTVADRLDECPGQTEDLDGFQDEDGCPDVDNDRDGVADLVDSCADRPGLGPDGCPDNRVTVKVRDAGGLPLPLAEVVITKDGQPVEKGRGEFQAELEPGLYEIEARQEGYEPGHTRFRVYPDDLVIVTTTLTRDPKVAPAD